MKQPFLILSFLAFFFFSCGKNTEENRQRERQTAEVTDQSTPVKAVRLDYSDFTRDLIANGTVSAQRRADLRFSVSERITVIHVKNGDQVQRGQKIAELDRFRLEKSLLQARDNFERAKLDLQDVLIGQGFVLRDTAEIPAEVMTLAKIRSNYEQSRINYLLAQENLNNSVLTAPFSGVVANLFSGVYNQSAVGEIFCTIIDNQQLNVDFNILETELPFVRRGDRVLVSPFAINDFTVEGRITEINPVVDRNGLVRVRASLQAGNKLYEGMNVRVLIQQKIDRQLVIPKNALLLRNNREVVFTLNNNRAHWVYVETGLENSFGFVVLDGLQVGDSIIFEGNINLAHESRVALIND
jgi:RND family efflux transporter MFP subunit